MKEVLIIVPAYNEALNILNVINDIETNLKAFDYIVINDCSCDNTASILASNNINHINLPVNLGLSGAVQAGYKYAYKHGYRAAIQFDGDGQHQAKYIERLYAEMKKGYDIVIGSRFVNEHKKWNFRMMGSRLITFLIKIKTGKTITDPTSGMRLLNNNMIYDYAFNMNRKPEPDTLVYQIKSGAKIMEVQVEMNERMFGESIYSNWFKSLHYMLTTCISILFFM